MGKDNWISAHVISQVGGVVETLEPSFVEVIFLGGGRNRLVPYDIVIQSRLILRLDRYGHKCIVCIAEALLLVALDALQRPVEIISVQVSFSGALAALSSFNREGQ